MDGALVLILHTHLPYVLHHGKWPHGSDWLCEAAAECYIPILNECYRLLEDGIRPGLTVSVSPVVAEQLADPDFPDVLNFFLDEKIQAAIDDAEYFAGQPQDHALIPLARFWRTWYTTRKKDFNERYKRDLVAAFGDLQEQDAISLQTCAATHGYLPLLGTDRSVNMQVDMAVASHTRRFGVPPRGIWMPECAYRPCYNWHAPVAPHLAPQGLRLGVEQVLARHGMEYTVIDAHQTHGGVPLNVQGYVRRFTRGSASGLGDFGPHGMLPMRDERSIYDLYNICSTGNPDAGMTAIFTRDTQTTFHVWSGDYGYPGSPNYLEFHKRHHNNGLRYWRVTDPLTDLGNKQVYQPRKTGADIRRHALEFVQIVEEKLRRFRHDTGRAGTLTAPFDTELFGHWWFEGPRFLGEVLRLLAGRDTVQVHTAWQELDRRDPQVAVQIAEGSWGDGGDHRVWMNRQTDWTWVSVYNAEQEFYELLDTRQPGDPHQERLLRQLAREVLLQQASDWQFLITTKSAADYAIGRIIGHQDAAAFLCQCIRRLRTGRKLKADDWARVQDLEKTDRIFPELELDLLSEK